VQTLGLGLDHIVNNWATLKWIDTIEFQGMNMHVI
jgi:hypothetical protein